MGEKERREYYRIEDEFNVRIAREVNENEFKDMAIDIAKSVNVSASGMLLNIKETLDEKDLLRVTFLKPNTFEFFESLAKVVRVKPNNDGTYQIALQFFNLTTSEQKKLDYYIVLCK